MGLRRARRAHAPDGPAWSLKPGAFAVAIQQGLCVLEIGFLALRDAWREEPSRGLRGVVEVPMFAGLPSSGLRAVRGVGRHAKPRLRILKNQGSAS